MPMPVFEILVVIVLIGIWYFCAKYFSKIGNKAEKSAKPFTEAFSEQQEEKEGDNQKCQVEADSNSK